MVSYQFPVSNKFQANAVTDLTFPFEEYEDQLYVELDEMRGSGYLDQIKYDLNVDEDFLIEEVPAFPKIIFSGHRGCGKTTELRRFHKYVNDPSRYISILIDLEKEAEIGTFQVEDLFVLLIAKTIGKLEEEKLDLNSSYLNEILKEWLSEEEVKKELKTHYDIKVETEAGAGIKFFGFLQLASKFKAIFSHASHTAKTIREKIKTNPLQLINRFNQVLSDFRQESNKKDLGKDLLFILDGTEKIREEIYQKLFILEPHLIHSIQANVIFSVPIDSFYDILNKPTKDFFKDYTLPMLPVTPESIPVLEKIVTKRIREDLFFEKGVLKFCVENSGGCPRQLLRIVNRALVISLGKKISLEVVNKACEELGQDMWDLLDSEHIDILKEEKLHTADKKVRELLFSLVILKYNGERKINPLIERHPLFQKLWTEK